MRYSDFTLEHLRHQVGVKVRDCALFSPGGNTAPSPWLVHSLEMGMGAYTTSVKSRGELIVAPILLECRSHLKSINIFSGAPLNADADAGLIGDSDFILARTRSRVAMQTPLVVIRQATEHDIVGNIGPCAAQMLGAIKYNERMGSATPRVYGCVTNGYSWLFLRLQDLNLDIHPDWLDVTKTGRLLWLLVECAKDVEKQLRHEVESGTTR